MKLKILSFVVILLAAGSIAASLFRMHRQNRLADQQKKALMEIPTEIREDVTNERQRKHSKLFGSYKQDVTHGKTIRDLVTEKGNVSVARGIGNVILPNSSNIDDYFSDISCRADAVIIGTVLGKSSNLTEDGSFTFTEYDFLVEEIVKDSSASPIQLNSRVTVVRPGGAVKFLGHIVRAIDHSQKTLSLGTRYLLFVKSVSGTGAFRSFGDARGDDSFIFEAAQVAQVSDSPLPLGPARKMDSTPFNASVRMAARKPCE